MLPELSNTVAEAVMAKLGRVLSRSSSERAEVPALPSKATPDSDPAFVQPMLPAPVHPQFDKQIYIDADADADADGPQPSPSIAKFAPPHSLVRHVPRPTPPAPRTAWPSVNEVVLVAATSSSSLSPPSDDPAAAGHASAHQEAAAMEEAEPWGSIFLDLTSSDLEPFPSPSPLLSATKTPPSLISRPIPSVVGQRKRRVPVPVESDLEVEEETKTPPKRLRRDRSSHVLSRATSVWSKAPWDRDSLDSSIGSSTPDLTTREKEESIQGAIRRLFGNPHAQEKSREQMDALMAIMNQDLRDMVVVLKTGGGKSLLWMIPPLLSLDGISVVICPFRALMEEQYQRCMKAGIRCHNYGRSKEVGEGMRILFLQVEHVGSEAFQRHVVRPCLTLSVLNSLLTQSFGAADREKDQESLHRRVP